MISLLMQDSLGKKLHAARTAKAQTVEDVAFKTRIPADRIRELENDDFSNFGNLTYAKSFLRLYGNYLELDLAEQLREFDTHTNKSAELPTDFLTPSGTAQYNAVYQPKGPPPWVSVAIRILPILAILAAAIWFFTWLYKRGGEDEVAPSTSKPAPAEVSAPAKAAEPEHVVTPEPAPPVQPIPEKPATTEVPATPAAPAPPAPPAPSASVTAPNADLPTEQPTPTPETVDSTGNPNSKAGGFRPRKN